MGVTYDHIPSNLITWIEAQYLFFVGTSALSVPLPVSESIAPISTSNPTSTPTPNAGTDEPTYQKNPSWGYTNISPKDMQGFQVVNPNRVRYQDVTGSGIETIAHLRQPNNAKLTIMFVALQGGPRVLRLFGKGKVLERSTREFEEILPTGDERIRPGCRAIIELDVEFVGTSCGFSIPYFDYVKERPVLDDWARKRVKADLFGSSSPTPKATVDEIGGDDGQGGTTEEESFSRLLFRGRCQDQGEGQGEEEDENGDDVAREGLRNYWNHVNSRSRDLLVGLDELAPKNRVRGVEGQGGRIEVFKIGGNEVGLIVKPDGSAVPVPDQVEGEKIAIATTTTTTPPARLNRLDSPLIPHRPTVEESQASNTSWDRRLDLLPSDQHLSTLSIDENTMYPGKTVLKLIRRERMRGSRSIVGWDQVVMGVCLVVVGVSIGLMGNGVLRKFGIDL